MATRRKKRERRLAEAGGGGSAAERPHGSAKGKRYTPALKRECLALLAAGMMLEEVHRSKGPSTMTLYRWKGKAGPAGDGAAAGRNEAPDLVNGRGTSADADPAGVEPSKSGAPHDNIAGLSDVEVAEILKLKQAHHSMGPAQIRAQLKRFQKWRIGIGSIARVLKANGYQVEHRSAREEQALQRFEAPRPNALWQMDALQFRVHKLRLYLHLVIDDFSRFIVGHRLSEEISSEEALATLQEAIAAHGKPERLLTDRGGQFLAVRGQTVFMRFLEAELIDHSVSRPYHPQTLGKVESVNRAIQKELLYLHEFNSPDETRAAIAAWVERYNFKRAHMGIDGVTPADRYFGLHRQVLAAVDARSRRREAVTMLDGARGGPVEEIGGALEVLRLVLVDGQIELRFCGTRVELGKVQG